MLGVGFGQALPGDRQPAACGRGPGLARETGPAHLTAERRSSRRERSGTSLHTPLNSAAVLATQAALDHSHARARSGERRPPHTGAPRIRQVLAQRPLGAARGDDYYTTLLEHRHVLAGTSSCVNTIGAAGLVHPPGPSTASLAPMATEFATRYVLAPLVQELSSQLLASTVRAALRATTRGRARPPSSISAAGPSLLLSHTPGRVRLRVPGLRGETKRAAGLVRQLEQLFGVRRVEANLLTGTVLVLFDPAAVAVQSIVAVCASGAQR